MHIGKKIKERRQELQWSQRELSDRMGYNNHSTIARIESGKVDVPQSRIIKFAEVLGVSVGHLMDWEEQREESISVDPVGTAKRHFEMIEDIDLVELFADFRLLDARERKMVKDLAHSLAETKMDA